MRFILTLFFLTQFIHFGFSQSPSLATYKGTMSVKGKQRTSHFTIFEFPEAKVKRELWKYSVRFASLDNLRAYYELAVPEDGKRKRNKIVFLLLIENLGSSTKIYISPRDEVKYLKKAEELLIDFKVQFYTNYFQEKIDAAEESLARLDKSMTASGNQELQTKMEKQLKLRDEYLFKLYSIQ